jgi:rare lipoprotein A
MASASLALSFHLMKRLLFSLLLLCPLSGQAATLQCGRASYYGTASDGYAWQTMANGKPMNPQAMTTAHPWLPFGTRLKVVNQSNGKSVILQVTDRGPYVHGRIVDLSIGALSRISSPSAGIAKVCISKA